MESDASSGKDGVFDTSLLCPDVIMEISEEPFRDRRIDQKGQDTSPDDYNITEPNAKFELSAQEIELKRERISPEKLSVQYTKIHCTACNVHLGSAMTALKNVFVHPLLKVLVCLECFDLIKGEDFGTDEDGTDLYCTWCGQGGTVVCCSKCPKVFCTICIKLNFNANKLLNIEANDEWACFACDLPQLAALRVNCYQFGEYVRGELPANVEFAADKNFSEMDLDKDYTLCCPRTSKKRKGKYASIEDAKNKFSGKFPDRNQQQTEQTLIQLSKFLLELPKKLPKSSNQGPEEIVQPIRTNAGMDTNANLVAKFDKKEWVETQKSGSTQPKLTESPLTYIFTNVSTKPLQCTNTNPITTESITPTTTFPATSQLQQNTAPPLLVRKIQPRLIAVSSSGPTADEICLKKTRMIERSICATALVNSTCASALLQLEQMQRHAKSVDNHVSVYNSLQESINTSILSFIQIRAELEKSQSETTPNPAPKLSHPIRLVPTPTYMIAAKPNFGKENQYSY